MEIVKRKDGESLMGINIREITEEEIQKILSCAEGILRGRRVDVKITRKDTHMDENGVIDIGTNMELTISGWIDEIEKFERKMQEKSNAEQKND